MPEPAPSSASPAPDPALESDSPRPPGPTRLWRNAEIRDRVDRRSAKIVAVGAMLVVAAGLVTLVGWLQPVARPALIILGGPVGGHGAIPQWTGDRAALRRLEVFEPDAGEALTVDEGIAAITDNTHAGTLVVYLAARVWVSAPAPTEPAPPVRLAAADGPLLADLVRALADRPAAHKLLILDLSPPADDPRAVAVLADRVGDLARGERVSILVSSEPGQRPVALESLGRSVFGYVVEQGLKGAADASGDGRITTRELAAFARDRVGRWSRLVLDVDQTPVLYAPPDADDFPLAVAPRRLPVPADLPKDAPAYPEWLTLAWRERDTEQAAGTGREAPRPFGQFEAAILQAEGDWRSGLDESKVRAELLDRLGRLRERIAPTRLFPHPAPRSLALAAALGRSPDPEILRATREAFAKRPKPAPDAKPGEREAAEAKLIADFFDPAKLKLRAEFDLAHAVFRTATDDPAPSPESIAFLQQMLSIRQPQPLYAETAALAVTSKTSPADWKPDRVRKTLILVRDGERLRAQPLTQPGGSTLLNTADRLRHEVEVLIGSPGYASAVEVDRRLVEAQNATGAALTEGSVVAEARRLADEAASLLPKALPLLGVAPELERPWLVAADEAREVVDLLEQSPGTAAGRVPDDLSERTAPLRVVLAGFEPGAIAARVARLARAEPPPGPADLRSIAALLQTPLPTVDGRLALWKAGIAAERRLVAALIKRESRDGRAVRESASRVIGSGLGLAASSGAGSKPRRDPVAERLLALGGAAEVPGTSYWVGLVAALDGKTTAAARDRLARLVPPWLAVPSIDDPTLDPTRARRAEEFGRLRRWLAARYAFDARDAGGSEFDAEAARDFAEPGDRPGGSIRLDAEPTDPDLTPEDPEATIRVNLQAVDAAGPVRVVLEVAVADGDWLEIEPGSPWPEDLGPPPRAGAGLLRYALVLESKPVEVPVLVRLRPESGSRRAPIPPGLIVRARAGDATWHRLVPLRIESAAHRLRLALTADPAAQGPDLGEVRLRAAQGKISRYLTLRNPGPRERTVRVELADRRGVIDGASVPLVVKAGGSVPVVFGPPAGKPEDGLLPIEGPLVIRVTDPTDPAAAVVVRSIDVGLAAPADYARVVAARFEPAGARNGERSKLEVRVRAVGTIEGPPCPVELSLPPDRIPGLIFPGEGTYAGKLTKAGDEVTLSVDGIKLDDREGEAGTLDLAIDGVERAIVLRTQFATRDRATTPVAVTRPAIRLQVGASGLSTGLLPVGVELDSPPEGGRVVVELGQNSADGFRVDSAAEVDSSRGRIKLNPRGAAGALVFEAEVRRLAVTLDLGKIRGRRLVRASLLDERGELRASAVAPLILDDQAPTAVEWVDVPKYGLKGGVVALRATASVPESGFKEVNFFLGKPVDGKRPAGLATTPGRPVDLARTIWATSLPLADAKLGPGEVSVEFVAGVGLSRFATAPLAVVETIPIEPGKIRGTVLEGNRPQPAFEVRALDEKGAEKAKAKTDDEGRFELAGLAPGNYDVVCVKLTPPARGTAKATVKPGETAVVAVAMFR